MSSIVKPEISVIGTGNMGSAVAEGLVRRGYPVTIYNRTVEKTKRLEALGATVAKDMRDALQASELVIIGLFDASAISNVFFEPAGSLNLEGRRVLNIAHTTPDEIELLSKRFAAAGARLSEVTIPGYPDNVRNGDGQYILAGPDEDRLTWKSVFGELGTHVHHVGSIGRASRAEMALWLPYAFQTIAVAYAVAAFEKEGLPAEVMESVLTTNPILKIAAAAPAISAMAKRAYGEDQWSVNNMVASIDMIIAHAKALGLPSEVFESIYALYVRAASQGFGRSDVAAVYEIVSASSRQN